jgi:hypothetical protein
VLELTRLEAVDRDVFQPRLQRLEGPESILALLRRSDEGQQLAASAAHLMRARHEDDRAFDAADGDWVPSNEGPAPGAERGEPSTTEIAALTRVLADLRAEIVVLRASHGRLRERVMVLEAGQSGASALNGRLPRGGRRRRSEPPPAHEVVPPPQASPGPLPVALAATQASPGLVAPPAAAKASPSAKPGSALGLPTVEALGATLATLMDPAPDLQLEPGEPMLWKLSEPRAVRLLDEGGSERGAIIVDATAAVQLGAFALSLPFDEGERQLRENQPSEEVLLAASEICSNLVAPLNALPGNEPLHATPLSSVDVTELPQVRVSLNLSVQGGRVVIALF